MQPRIKKGQTHCGIWNYVTCTCMCVGQSRPGLPSTQISRLAIPNMEITMCELLFANLNYQNNHRDLICGGKFLVSYNAIIWAVTLFDIRIATELTTALSILITHTKELEVLI